MQDANVNKFIRIFMWRSAAMLLNVLLRRQMEEITRYEKWIVNLYFFPIFCLLMLDNIVKVL